MRNRIRADFQLGIVTRFGFCSAAVISPFAVYRFLTGVVAVGVLDTVLVISIVAIVLYAWRSGSPGNASILPLRWRGVCFAGARKQCQRGPDQ